MEDAIKSITIITGSVICIISALGGHYIFARWKADAKNESYLEYAKALRETKNALEIDKAELQKAIEADKAVLQKEVLKSIEQLKKELTLQLQIFSSHRTDERNAMVSLYKSFSSQFLSILTFDQALKQDATPEIVKKSINILDEGFSNLDFSFDVAELLINNEELTAAAKLCLESFYDYYVTIRHILSAKIDNANSFLENEKDLANSHVESATFIEAVANLELERIHCDDLQKQYWTKLEKAPELKDKMRSLARAARIYLLEV